MQYLKLLTTTESWHQSASASDLLAKGKLDITIYLQITGGAALKGL
jgi:hypothetical protein